MHIDRPRLGLPRFSVISAEARSKTADGQSPLPAGNRERLIRQFQGIDGCTRSEAERQIDAYERSFSAASGGSTITVGTPGEARN